MALRTESGRTEAAHLSIGGEERVGQRGRRRVLVPRNPTPPRAGGADSRAKPCSDQAPQRVWRSSRRGRSSVPSHQVAVARRKAAPQASLHVIRANALHPILDAPWHHVLVAREEVQAPEKWKAL